MQSIRRRLLVGLAAGALTVTLAPAASAHTPTTGVMATTSAAEGGETETLSARRGSKVIRCWIRVSDPDRYRSDGKRRVKVVTTVRCNRSVDRIRVRSVLRRGGDVVDRKSRRVHDRRHLFVTTSSRCVRHRSYQGVAHVRVNFPHGYRPSRDAVRVHGDRERFHRCR